MRASISVLLLLCFSEQLFSQSCQNWLNLPSATSYVDIGDLDIPGSAVTIEAKINRTLPWTGNDLWQGDVVSKHTGPNDCNYLLRPGSAEITTTNGYFKTPEICAIELNKTYHVALTYDGTTLKFYRNGFLMSQIPATGTLFQSNIPARIGLVSTNINQENFLGYINEVRIWNVARTQSQIQGFMGQSLPNPQTTPGLVAYYSFDNLLNKQGTAAWNGALGGSASVNQTNPACSFPIDSCEVPAAPPIVPSFIAPDTVCVNETVNITNTTTGQTTNYWNFCAASATGNPVGTNIGNPGSGLSSPVFMDYVLYNNNYYGFVVNYVPGGLVRLDFGNSLLNTPTAVNLGNFGGIIPPGEGAEGIQIVQNEGNWYVIIVGGYVVTGSTPRILKIDFGPNLTNLTPTATNWGNLGNMSQPIDLHVFKEGNDWYGFTVNAENNTITRFNFTNSFSNTPTATNLGNIGSLAYPTGIFAINDNGFWRVFVVNGGNNTRSSGVFSLTRLDFGGSLLNTPTGVNLGNPGNFLKHPRDVTIMKTCNEIVGYSVNGHLNNSDIIKFNFNNDLSQAPAISSVGNTGSLNFPHSLSKLFRVNNDIYGFITNVANSTITRLKIDGCTSSSPAGSPLQTPPPLSYAAPGTYNINLSVDDGLATQGSFCKQIVVMPEVEIDPMQNETICPGNSTNLNPTVTGATTYSWSPAAGLSDPTVLNPVASPTTTTTYTLTASNGNCSATETVTVQVLTPLQCGQIIVTPAFDAPDTVCVNAPINLTNNSVNATTYYWTFCAASSGNPPVGANLGNPGSTLTVPCFIDYVNVGGNYYGFITSNNSPSLTRLDFGNSLLNVPTVTNLGDFGGILPYGAQGIKIISENGKWYAIIVGGDILAVATSTPRVIKIDFGASITNNNPVATDWGNIGNLNYPTGLHMFKEAGIWYGVTINYVDGTITRLTFGPNFNNPPTGVNLGNLGGMDKPSGLFPINDNGTWRIFVANYGNHTLSRLDFGTSLLNAPTGVNLGNLGGVLNKPRDIYIFNDCGPLSAFMLNEATNSLLRLDFSNLSAVPTAVSIGNVGALNGPHSISKMFRVGSDIYSFVPNSFNNTISRISFPGCNNSSIASSNLQTPPTISYNAPGTYNINLMVDEGEPTQGAFCKKVVVMPELTHQPTQSFTICAPQTIRIGSSHAGGNYLWSTGATEDSITISASGTFWVETSRYGCMVRDSFVVTVVQATKPDFAYQQDMCSPMNVQFTSSLPFAQSFSWDFGNGQLNTTSQTPLVTYAGYGSYDIKLKVHYAACEDSVLKTILIDNLFDNNHLLNIDTAICLGDSVLLRPNGNMGNFCWKASAGPVPGFLTGYVSPADTTTYTFTSQLLGSNLVTNADFSSGDMDFLSDYSSVGTNSGEGEYSVGTNPSAWNPMMSSCPDHTSGTGNMMIVNGSPIPNATVWSQTVAVSPNTDYVFSIWLASAQSLNPANLHFSINNVDLGVAIIPGPATCQWQRFSTTWNSGSNTSATIAIVNNNTTTSGNDFLIDDVFFGTTITKTDSFTVNLTGLCDTIDISGINKVCSPTDTLTYAIYRSAACAQPFDLFTDNNFVQVIEQTPSFVRLVFLQNGQTKIKVAFQNECKLVADSIDIDIKFSPAPIDIGPDVVSCKDTSLLLDAGAGFETYLWQDGSGGQTFQLNAPGTYFVEAQDFCGAFFRDTIVVVKNSSTPFGVSPMSATVCSGDSVQFTATGGDQYEWQPAGNFASPGSASTMAIVSSSQNYTVHIVDQACQRDTLINIPVTASTAAIITASKSNDASCSNDSAVLTATGGVSYLWSPNLYITRTNNSSITVKPPQTVTYYVQGTDAAGCVGIDSVTVAFINEGEQKLFVPDAFTPNGDGLNDVFRPAFIGPAAKYDFSIYNRWGQLIFRSKVPGVGWNGVYQSKQQPGGVYVYYLTAEGGCNGKFEAKGTFVLLR